MFFLLFGFTFASLAAESAENREDAKTGAAKKRVLKLTLKDAVELAKTNALTLQIAEKGVEKAAEDVVLAAAGLEPYLNGSFNFSHTQGVSLLQFGSFSMTSGEVGKKSETATGSIGVAQKLSLGTQISLSLMQSRHWADGTPPFSPLQESYYSTGLSLYVSQPLLKGFGKSYNNAPIFFAEKALKIASEEHDAKMRELVLGIEEAYWNLVAMRELLAAQEKSLKIAQDLEEMTKKRIDVGMVAKIELTQAKLNVAMRRQVLISVANAVNAAQDALIMLIGTGEKNEYWDYEIELADAATLPEFERSVDAAVEKALVSRPEYKQLKNLLQIKERALSVALLNTLPSIDLTGSISMSGLDMRPADSTAPLPNEPTPTPGEAWKNLTKAENGSWMAGINFSMSLFRAPETAAYKKAKAELDETKLGIKNFERAIVFQIRAAARQVRASREQLDAAKLAEQLATERLESAQKSQDVGIITNIDFQQIQEMLDAARAERIRATVGYILAVSAFEAAEGSILEKYRQ